MQHTVLNTLERCVATANLQCDRINRGCARSSIAEHTVSLCKTLPHTSCSPAHMHECMHVCATLPARVHMHTHTHARTHTHTHAHTYIHTRGHAHEEVVEKGSRFVALLAYPADTMAMAEAALTVLRGHAAVVGADHRIAATAPQTAPRAVTTTARREQAPAFAQR
jgi:hypothetical protein